MRWPWQKGDKKGSVEAAPGTKVPLDQLMQRLDSAFDKSLASRSSRIELLLKKIKPAADSFSASCTALTKSTAEPNMDFMSVRNAPHIKSQKEPYAMAISSIVHGMRRSYDESTMYANWSAELGDLNLVIDRVLKTNGNFKYVVQAYAKELLQAKRLFEEMQALQSQIKGEMDSMNGEFTKHASVSQLAETILLLSEELAAVNDEISVLGSVERAGSAANNSGVDELLHKIDEKKKEMASLEKQIKEAENSVATTMLQLEKAAMRYDHDLHAKIKLSTQLSEPVSAFLEKDFDYTAFVKRVEGMCRDIAGNKIEVKNKDSVLKAADEIISGRQYKSMEALKELYSKRAAISAEVSLLSRSHELLKEEEGKQKSLIKKEEELKSRRDTLQKEIGTKRTEIESLFLKHYGEQISITAPDR